VIVASEKALGQRSGLQQRVLRRAADDTRSETIAATNESVAAAAYCRAGGTVATAPAAALQALRVRTAPLVTALRRDPVTRALIAEVERLRPGASLRTCGPDSEPAGGGPKIDVLTPRSPFLVPPIGSYRRVFTSAGLRAAGAGPLDARRNEGVMTMTFEGECCIPRFALTWQGPDERPPCRGLAELVHGLVDLWWNPATPCTGHIAFAWRLDGADLLIVGLDSGTTPAWIKNAYRGTWKRVDCAPSTESLSTHHPRYSDRDDRQRPCSRQPR
jgi:hypothetical protein